jgi:hypothetical protein
MEVEEGQSSRAGFQASKLSAAYEIMAEANLSFRVNTADIGASLRRLGPAVELEILPDILKIRRVNSAVKQFRHLG